MLKLKKPPESITQGRLMKVKLPILLLIQVIALFSTLPGCSSSTGGARSYLVDKQAVLLAKGNPPSYVDGYIDGCSTGKRMGGDRRFAYKRDGERAEREALYARGWQEGQITCKNETLRDDYYRQSEQGVGSSVDAERHRRVEAESRAAEAEMREIWEELKK